MADWNNFFTWTGGIAALVWMVSLIVLCIAAGKNPVDQGLLIVGAVAFGICYIIVMLCVWLNPALHEYWHAIIAVTSGVLVIMAVGAIIAAEVKNMTTVEVLSILILIPSVAFLAIYGLPPKLIKTVNSQMKSIPRLPDMSQAKWPAGSAEITLPPLYEHGAIWIAKEKDVTGKEFDKWVSGNGLKYIPLDPKATEMSFFIQYLDGMTTDVGVVKKGTTAVPTGRRTSTRGISWPKADRRVTFPEPQEIGAQWIVETTPGTTAPALNNTFDVPGTQTDIKVYLLYQDGTRTEPEKVEQQK